MQTEVVVIGAGIAGLSVAYCLASEGRQVVVVEDGLIGSGESGRTTAHLVTSLDDRYYRLERIFGEHGAMLAAESHTAAIDFIERILEKERIMCDFERLEGYLFRHPSDDRNVLIREMSAASRAGVLVEMLGAVPGMMNQEGPCLKFPGQAQFHIMKYLNGLAGAISRYGGHIFTGTHASTIDHKGLVSSEGFKISAKHVVVATNTPVNDKFVIHTKQAPYRSYVIGAKIRKGLLRRALWWDTGDHSVYSIAPPYHYVRLQDLDDTYDLLICGGEDHPTGGAGVGEPEEKRYELLESWARRRFPLEQVLYRWSGQIMETIDALAFIGRNPMDHSNVYIITGDSGNGITHGTIGGLLIRDLIKGKKNEWAQLYDPGRFKILKGGRAFIKENMAVVLEYFRELLYHPAYNPDQIKKQEGRIVEIRMEKYGVYRDGEDNMHMVSAVCPHLGCIVKWNKEENSWDCPCHGSRFTIEGKVMNGPANVDLAYYRGALYLNSSKTKNPV